jgi:ribosome biogenesis protein BMS1
MRFLKYSLEHAHCHMTYYGPSVPPNTGVMAFRSWNKVAHFRICGTGGVLETAPNFDIVKKLKLVGEPYKIFRNTAFIKNMFSSDLEVNKYKHTKIQTVSGVRGEIKKAEGNRGSFRATFEDRILLSDLVVCKCWIGVRPREFYHPVVDVNEWRPARLIGELRAENGVAVPHNKDSVYGKQVERANRKFNPLKIPNALDGALPFKSRSKNEKKKTPNKLRKKAAVVSSERDRSINSLMQRLHTVRKEKQRIRKDSSSKKKVLKEKREAFIQEKRDFHNMETRKKRYVKEGMEEGKKRKAMRLE